MPNQTHNSSQGRLTDAPNQAHRYAKSGSRLCQIRLKNKPNQAHMPHKCAKPGIQGQIRRPLPDTLERKSSYPFHSSLGQRHRTHLQRGEAN